MFKAQGSILSIAKKPEKKTHKLYEDFNIYIYIYIYIYETTEYWLILT
jgi:hypothetical protein